MELSIVLKNMLYQDLDTEDLIQIPPKLTVDFSGLWLKHINGSHKCASMLEHIHQFSPSCNFHLIYLLTCQPGNWRRAGGLMPCSSVNILKEKVSTDRRIIGPSSYCFFPDFHRENNKMAELKVDLDTQIWPIILHRYLSRF